MLIIPYQKSSQVITHPYYLLISMFFVVLHLNNMPESGTLSEMTQEKQKMCSDNIQNDLRQLVCYSFAIF